VVADVTDEWAMGTALNRLRSHFGPIDLLINNAGIVGPFGPTWEANLDDWWQVMEVNVKGTLIATQLALPEMVGRRHGRILNMSSHAGVFRWPMVSAYSVSKASIVKFTENLALETSRYGIPVFSVHPGLLQIGMGEAIANEPDPDDLARAHVYAWVRQEWEEGRGADPVDAVDLLVRLASGRYDALSGRQLSVHDDIDGLLEQIEDVRRDDLYVLGLKKLPPVVQRQRWKSA
jgi:NAD(P)-dependent dehydrogenase (short-subunit alcohol dehydrogenase family)